MNSDVTIRDGADPVNGAGSLAGITVLDCGSSLTAPFACQLLRGLGADVIKVEDPDGGDELRRRGPFLRGQPGQDTSGLFHYVNGGKKGVTLSLRTPAGKTLLYRLAALADVLVDDRPMAATAEAGLGYETLREVNPALIVASITPFGHTGPWADFPGTDLTLYHASGLAYATPGLVADPETQPPLRAGSYQASFVPALGAAINIVAALTARDLSNAPAEGCFIDFSCYEAATNALRQGIGSYAFHGTGLNRRLSRGRGAGGMATARNIRCKDGYVQLWVAGERQWEALRDLIGDPEWMNDPRAATSATRAANWPFVEQHLVEWTSQLGKQELFFLCQGRGITCAPVQDGEDLVNADVFETRGFWDEVALDDGTLVRLPGAPLQMSVTPWIPKSRAPRLGEHNVEILCERLGLPEGDLAALKDAGAI